MVKLAFVFPGQGSQTVGMMDSWQDNKVVLDTIKQGSESLGQDLSVLMAQGPADQLNLTTNTQPVMLVASVAIYRAWIEAGGPKPELMAGHSLGEYSALTAAGVFDLSTAVKLVRIRADAMQQAVPVGTGSMAAILGLDDATVEKVCAEAAQGEIVEAVNFNAPAQVVIAGHKSAIERACELAKEAGAKRALPLPVSAPFHSTLLKPAADILSKAISELTLAKPEIDVINNVDVKINNDPESISDALVRQSYHPVQWVKTIKLMKEKGITHIVECGPGKVLTGLIKRIDKDIQGLSINDPESLKTVLENINS